MSKLVAPRAILLDFGGVIVSTEVRDGWAHRVAERVWSTMHEEGVAMAGITRGTVEQDISAAAIADSHWKNAMSRTKKPIELKEEEFWGEFVAADWPTEPRAFVTRYAKSLCQLLGEQREKRELRDGIIEFFELADANDVRLGIVSNTLQGQVHRDFLQSRGLTRYFATQLYSNETGVRKPNPDFIRMGAEALHVSVQDCWYVGDNFDRDVLCGERAQVGLNVLMEAKNSYKVPYPLNVHPDVTVQDPAGLSETFLQSLG